MHDNDVECGASLLTNDAGREAPHEPGYCNTRPNKVLKSEDCRYHEYCDKGGKTPPQPLEEQTAVEEFLGERGQK
jgi:hypothetical protein